MTTWNTEVRKEQEKEGYSIPAQLKFRRDHAAVHDLQVVQEFTYVETAKKAGRKAFGEMVAWPFLERWARLTGPQRK